MTGTALLIDDHTLFRVGLALILSRQLARTLEAGSVDQARALVAGQPALAQAVDLLLLDIQLPGLSGLQGMGLLRRDYPRARVLVLSGSDTQSQGPAAQQAGADGFLLKSATAEQIHQAVARLLAGESLFDSPAGASAGQGLLAQPGTAAGAGPHLTERQLEVLALLCEGWPNKVIGRRLNLSENTVRGHVSAVLALLGVANRAEAGAVARSRGMVH